METNLNTMELEISLIHEEEDHESELSLAKECRNYFNETKKKFLDRESHFFKSKQKMLNSDSPLNNNAEPSCKLIYHLILIN